jgi:hypothetical protein
MTRRRILCGLLLLSAVLACFAGWLWMANAGHVRAMQEQAKKGLRPEQVEGMTREQVVRTVGLPNKIRDDEYVYWLYEGYGATLVIDFDDAGKVCDVERIPCGGPATPPPTLTERIRRWLGL